MMGIYFDKVVGCKPTTLLIIELVQFFSSVFRRTLFLRVLFIYIKDTRALVYLLSLLLDLWVTEI